MLTVALTDFAVDGGAYFAAPKSVPVERLGVRVLDAFIAFLERSPP